MRDTLIKQLQWNNGGMSMGITPVAYLFMSRMNAKELPSCVVVSGPPDKYTDEELEKLVKFSEDKSAIHRKLCGNILSSDNLTCIDKQRDGTWFHKRLSWDRGRMTSNTLDEAIEFMMDA